jgi:hypothetical protein
MYSFISKMNEKKRLDFAMAMASSHATLPLLREANTPPL